MSITTLIFDWHGVLDRVTFEKHANNTSLPIKKIRQLIHDDERAYTAGLISPDKFWAKMRRKFFFVPKRTIDKIRAHVLVLQPNQALWNLLPKLAKQYQLAILSDCSADKLAVIRKKADLSLFAAAHFSCEKQTFKANDDFFLNLVKELGVKPKACLYIDDSARHIAVAKRLGFRTCLFKAVKDLTISLGKKPK